MVFVATQLLDPHPKPSPFQGEGASGNSLTRVMIGRRFRGVAAARKHWAFCPQIVADGRTALC